MTDERPLATSLPAVELAAVPCWYCAATGRCSTCDGTGKWSSAAFSVTPISDRCRHCGGVGKCPTCDGTGSRRRVRRPVAPPLTVASAGFEICWSCGGTRLCNVCNGSGVKDSGEPCNRCYMRSGICLDCDGEGQLRADQ